VLLSGTPSGSAGGGRWLSAEKERSLQQRLVARDERALVELVDVATPWLLGVALGMLSDSDEAEEVLQEAFTIAWRRADLLELETGTLMPWLLRIVRNRAIDRLRASRRRRLKAERLTAYQALGEGVEAAREPDESALPGWHVHERVRTALDALPPDQRAAVRLAYFEGLTQSEIASQLGIPLGTVKTRLRLAFDRLRTSLGSLREWVL
jgi:RNA polymerase sigma-70 factor (ECF subfamily)